MPEPKANTTQTCYFCGKIVDPANYKTYYHSFTATYFCSYEHYRTGYDQEISKAIGSGFKKANKQTREA